MEIPFSLALGLHRLTPTQNTCLELGCALAVGGMAIELVRQCYPSGWMRAGKGLLNRVPTILERQKQEIDSNYKTFCREWSERYLKFEGKNLSIPEEGWSEEQLISLICQYASLTNDPFVDRHFSGTVYLNAYNQKEEKIGLLASPNIIHNDMGLNERIMLLQTKLFPAAFKVGNLWNPLHADEFSVGPFINYQLIRMAADSFGGDPDEVKGVVTGGGTESLMTAAKAYRNWGKRTKGLGVGECVIVAPKSIHAALLKAGEDYEVTIALADTDADGRVDLVHMEELMRKYSKGLVAVFASAPSYATGIVDDIGKIAALAGEYGCGMHVDACLGGFVVNFLNEESTYLALPGVTSLSCDTHKNGLGTKGSSVLVTKQLGAYNLIFDAIYAYPNWEGVYATPTMAGSQSSVPAFTALLAMLCIGKAGYRKMAKRINDTVVELSQGIENRSSHKVRVIGSQQANVLAIKMDERHFRKGAIYAFVQKMKENGVVLNALKGQRAHFCVTYRFAEKKNAVDEFLTAMEASLKEVEKINGSSQAFPGEAVIYGTLHEVFNPQLNELGWKPFLENLLFGADVAEASVKKWVEAGL